MSVEVKCLTIEFFLKSHLVISTGTDEKIHRLCEVVFEFEDSSPGNKNVGDYQKALEYIKHNILKAIAVIKKEVEPYIQGELHQSISEIEAAPTGESILTMVENISDNGRKHIRYNALIEFFVIRMKCGHWCVFFAS